MNLKNFPKRLDSKTSCLRITVPENLDLALEGLIRKVLREQPKTDDIYSFAADYFETLLKIRDNAGPKLTADQLCPFHNDEDAHEMIKLATSFAKPHPRTSEPPPSASRMEKPSKKKQSKPAKPDALKTLPVVIDNQPEMEFLSSDPIKELVEKELMETKSRGAESVPESVIQLGEPETTGNDIVKPLEIQKRTAGDVEAEENKQEEAKVKKDSNVEAEHETAVEKSKEPIREKVKKINNESKEKTDTEQVEKSSAVAADKKTSEPEVLQKNTEKTNDESESKTNTKNVEKSTDVAANNENNPPTNENPLLRSVKETNQEIIEAKKKEADITKIKEKSENVAADETNKETDYLPNKNEDQRNKDINESKEPEKKIKSDEKSENVAAENDTTKEEKIISQEEENQINKYINESKEIERNIKSDEKSENVAAENETTKEEKHLSQEGENQINKNISETTEANKKIEKDESANAVAESEAFTQDIKNPIESDGAIKTEISKVPEIGKGEKELKKVAEEFKSEADEIGNSLQKIADGTNKESDESSKAATKEVNFVKKPENVVAENVVNEQINEENLQNKAQGLSKESHETPETIKTLTNVEKSNSVAVDEEGITEKKEGSFKKNDTNKDISEATETKDDIKSHEKLNNVSGENKNSFPEDNQNINETLKPLNVAEENKIVTQENKPGLQNTISETNREINEASGTDSGIANIEKHANVAADNVGENKNAFQKSVGNINIVTNQKSETDGTSLEKPENETVDHKTVAEKTNGSPVLQKEPTNVAVDGTGSPVSNEINSTNVQADNKIITKENEGDKTKIEETTKVALENTGDPPSINKINSTNEQADKKIITKENDKTKAEETTNVKEETNGESKLEKQPTKVAVDNLSNSPSINEINSTNEQADNKIITKEYDTAKVEETSNVEEESKTTEANQEKAELKTQTETAPIEKDFKETTEPRGEETPTTTSESNDSLNKPEPEKHLKNAAGPVPENKGKSPDEEESNNNLQQQAQTSVATQIPTTGTSTTAELPSEELCRVVDVQEISKSQPNEEELCAVVDIQNIPKNIQTPMLQVETPQIKVEEVEKAQSQGEKQIKTIQTHYYNTLQVPEVVTKEYRLHTVATETMDNLQEPILDDLMTPTSVSSLDLSELSWRTVTGMFLDSEKRYSSIKPEENRSIVEEVFNKTVLPTSIHAVPVPPRDSSELNEENQQENVKDKPENASSDESKSTDSDVPFISVEVKTLIETQILDDENEQKDEQPEVEVKVEATIDVLHEPEIGKQEMSDGANEEKTDLEHNQDKSQQEQGSSSTEQTTAKEGSSGESESTLSSAPTEIKRTDSGKRNLGFARSLLSTQSLDYGKRNPLMKTRSLSAFRHGVTDFEIWTTIERELEEAATKIQSKFRGYRTRKKLQRENAVQITTEESSVSTTPVEAEAEAEAKDEPQQNTGEFHDSIVLSEHPR